MLRNLSILAVLAAGPALANGIEIDVAGEANGTIVINLFEDVAPNHADRISTLAAEGAYNGVVFHRVINGFMAQTGDVQFGLLDSEEGPRGAGSSDLPDLDEEFSDIPFDRGVVGMARADSVNSANSQFFIMLETQYRLNGKYTVIGEVTVGLDVLDAIKQGLDAGGVQFDGDPDVMVEVRVID